MSEGSFGEFIVIQTDTNEKKEYADFWTINSTKMLIDLYKSHRSKVGTLQMRNFKYMWEKISIELSRMLNTPVSAKHAENKWKVLERRYKAYIDNNKATGRGRKTFEFFEEMNAIYGTKRNVVPEILLSSTTPVPPRLINDAQDIFGDDIQLNNSDKNIHNTGLVTTPTTLRQTKEQIREDRSVYQEKRIKLTEEKLKILERRNEILY
ncbi:hypothetical protein ABEB36_014160 [Hypothenemus hampei]|uniref:Myb/SANT-like DNA-binding domain-containing protein n=1 Tax=Hypothenemus hampei TaxID=57062 RepID=A0ABD1E5L9_HYPHA